MIANYHSHTYRCRHATGTEEAYVQAALQAGMQIFGFSDHAPQWFHADYYSTFRMYPEQLPDYVQTVLNLRQQYAGRIEIPLGLEAEYYPAYFPELLSRARDAGIEYLLLGQHFIGNEIGDHYCGRPTDDAELLKRYCRQTAQAMETGLFSYLAHPDLLHFTGPEETYRRHMRDLCRAANDCGTVLEMNLLGLAYGRHYPNPVFWEVAAQEGCRVIIGRDAHKPEEILHTESEAAARALAARLGLQTVDTVPLRRI